MDCGRIMYSLMELPPEQAKRIFSVLDDPDKACHLIFRLLGPIFQNNFAKLNNIADIPKVFIHGNPHLDNYARTFTGAGMVDFDRSRIGPYAWDVIRFLSSLALRGEDRKRSEVSKQTKQAFLDGYLATLINKDIYYSIPTFVKAMTPKQEQLTTHAYLDANIKWAKKMRKNPIDVGDQQLKKMLTLYLESRDELDLLNFYKIEEMGQSEGSLGKMHYLISLAPKDTKSKRDHILIDLKETYCELDNDLFSTPTDHHGLRMIQASNLYAPGVEQRLGHFSYKKKQYWGREIPAFNAKVKELMSESEQQEMAYCVGGQLGRGHGRSYREGKVKEIKNDILDTYDQYCELAAFVNREVVLGLDYLSKSRTLELSL